MNIAITKSFKTDFDETCYAAFLLNPISTDKISERSQRPEGHKVRGQNFNKLAEAILTIT